MERVRPWDLFVRRDAVADGISSQSAEARIAEQISAYRDSERDTIERYRDSEREESEE